MTASSNPLDLLLNDNDKSKVNSRVNQKAAQISQQTDSELEVTLYLKQSIALHEETKNMIKRMQKPTPPAAPKSMSMIQRVGVCAGLLAAALMIAVVTAYLMQQPVLNKTMINGKIYSIGTTIVYNQKKEMFVQIKGE